LVPKVYYGDDLSLSEDKSLEKMGSVGKETKGVCGRTARTNRIPTTFEGVSGHPKAPALFCTFKLKSKAIKVPFGRLEF
jgi:hypothetical protein